MRPIESIILILAALGGPVAGPALAQEQGPRSAAVEPIVGEETLPNDVGDWDLRVSAGYDRRGDRVHAAIPRAQLFFGIADRVGAELAVPFLYDREGAGNFGLGDIGVGFKWLAAPSVLGVAAVLGLESTVPTGQAGAGTGEGVYEFRPYLALMRDFGSWSAQGNAGWALEVERAGGAASHALELNGVVAAPVWRRTLFVIGEASGTVSSAVPETAYAVGARLFLREELSVAAALRYCTASESCRWGSVVQMQIGW